MDHLRPIQEEFTRLIGDKAYLEQCYTKSAEIALRISQRTLDKAMKKVGFVKTRLLKRFRFAAEPEALPLNHTTSRQAGERYALRLVLFLWLPYQKEEAPDAIWRPALL